VKVNESYKVGVNMVAMGDFVRAKLGLPGGWVAYSFDTKRRMKDGEALVEVRGCVPAIFKRGPRVGKLNYKGGSEDLSTHILISDVERWLLEREKNEGVCGLCHGSDVEWRGWSAATGTKTIPCRRCQPERDSEAATAGKAGGA